MASDSTIRLSLIQMRCDTSRDENLERAIDKIEQAANDGAQIVCLPELFLSPYFCQTEDHCHFDLAESVPGPTTETFSSIAASHNVVIIASLFERRAQGLYHNTTAVIDADGEYLGKYRKMHIPDDPQFYEKFYFTPGDLGFKVFDTKYARIGVLICWDQWFPEAARLTAMQGAELLVYPTAIGWLPAEKADDGLAQYDSWETIQRSHAIANGCYVAAVNRIGTEGAEASGIEFWGQSFACDPSGQILAKAAESEEQIVTVDLNRDQIDMTRTVWPFFRDRRIDAYDGLTKRFLDNS